MSSQTPTSSPDLRRVVVVGVSGAGKTTFARDLAQRLAIPHIELDSLYWMQDWTPREPPEFRKAVDRATAEERWVVDGNYGSVRDLVWPRATALVWLNYRLTLVFSRAMRRTLRRIVTREEVHNGNRESLRGAFLSFDGIPWWVLRTFGRRRREYPQLFAHPEHRHLHIIALAHPRDAANLLTTTAHRTVET